MSDKKTEMPSTHDQQADAYYGHSRREMLPFFPAKAGRILDVGCGSGGFGRLLKSALTGVEVWGVEPTQSAFDQARAGLDRVLHGYFDESLQLPDAHFDTIVFNDSLEHFPDERPALQLAHRLLKQDGRIVASIPNVRYWPHVQHYLLDGDWKYESAGILDRTHLRFFTRRSIERTFGEAGFVIQQLEGINPCWTGLKFKLLNTLFPGRTADMPFAQFAVVAGKNQG